MSDQSNNTEILVKIGRMEEKLDAFIQKLDQRMDYMEQGVQTQVSNVMDRIRDHEEVTTKKIDQLEQRLQKEIDKKAEKKDVELWKRTIIGAIGLILTAVGSQIIGAVVHPTVATTPAPAVATNLNK